MQQNHRQLFKFNEPEPPKQLLSVILRRIEQEKMHIYKRNTRLYAFATGMSFLTFVPAIQLLTNDLNHSGFLSYMSLAWNDQGAVLSYWQDFTLSLLESLPITSSIFALSVLLAAIASLRKTISNHFTFLTIKHSSH